MKHIISTFLIVFVLQVQSQSAQEILQKTINYHDPNGEWKTLKATFEYAENQPNGDTRKTILKLDNATNSHYLNRGDKEAYQINGKYEVEVLMGDKEPARGKMLRSYYVYLWGLPMKLEDKGTNLLDEVKTENIKGINCYKIRVKYEKESYAFFISIKSYQMVAYQFMKNDGSGKGENIYLEGEVKVGNMRIPKARSWYTIPENKFLGTDVLVKGPLTD